MAENKNSFAIIRYGYEDIFYLSLPVSYDGLHIDPGISIDIDKSRNLLFVFREFFPDSIPHFLKVNCIKKFNNSSELQEYLLPFARELQSISLQNDSGTEMESSINEVREDYKSLVSIAVDNIRKFDSNCSNAKIVTSTVMDFPSKKDLIQLFINASENYPEANVFLFSTPESGTWIGVSPELLLAADKDRIFTMALAGTRIRNYKQSDRKWDAKNLKEQEIVKSEILKNFNKADLNACVSPLYTRPAGKVEHLCNDISAPRPTEYHVHELMELASYLSPTPALGGYPRKFALDFISKWERYQRSYYGGFLGIVSEENLRLIVNLRSAQLFPKNKFARLHAGGGITSLSVPESELREIEIKMMTLSNIL